MKSLILVEETSRIGHESEEHADLALDVDFAVDVSGVGLDRAGPYSQHAGNFAVSETLANEFRDLQFARRQIVPALNIRPLLFI